MISSRETPNYSQGSEFEAVEILIPFVDQIYPLFLSLPSSSLSHSSFLSFGSGSTQLIINLIHPYSSQWHMAPPLLHGQQTRTCCFDSTSIMRSSLYGKACLASLKRTSRSSHPHYGIYYLLTSKTIFVGRPKRQRHSTKAPTPDIDTALNERRVYRKGAHLRNQTCTTRNLPALPSTWAKAVTEA